MARNLDLDRGYHAPVAGELFGACPNVVESAVGEPAVDPALENPSGHGLGVTIGDDYMSSAGSPQCPLSPWAFCSVFA